MTVVRLSHVWKRFDRVVAVRDVSLTIERGQLLGLIGPNGAGKTSVLRMIATLAKPDRGRVSVLGRDLRGGLAGVRARLGYMPAELGRMPDMSVEEYLGFFGAAAGVPRRERRRRVEDVLALVDLLDRRDMLVAAGSTGIKQRVLLAKTLVHDPELLVLDEPAAGLDPRARIEVREVLKELNRLGKTIVVSSHILADLEEICDHVAILEQGALVTHGSLAGLTDALRARSEKTAWRLRTRPEQGALAHELLAALPAVGDLSRSEEGLAFVTPERDANEALAALVRAGVVVLGFHEEGPRLEDVFLRRTRGAL